MKGPAALKEIHNIMEKIYKEKKGLTAEARIRKLREESERFIRERRLNLKRINPKELKHKVA